MPNIHYIDTHCHLLDPAFDADREQVIAEMASQNIYAVEIGTDLASSRKAVELANQHDNIYACIGLHPNTKETFDPADYEALLGPKTVAVGECGLDYYWLAKDLESGKISDSEFAAEVTRQKHVFQQQIDFATQHHLPLMLHVRDAHDDVLELLGGRTSKLPVNFHFFTAGKKTVRKVVEAGYGLSFPGVITYGSMDGTVAATPLTSIMAETDSPYAAPTPHRDQRCTPLMVVEVYKKITEIHGVEEEEVREQLVENAKRFFNIS